LPNSGTFHRVIWLDTTNRQELGSAKEQHTEVGHGRVIGELQKLHRQK
jgi:hypothetical protein